MKIRKEAKGKSNCSLADLRYRCTRFAREFKGGMAEITTGQVEDFLISLKLSTQSYMNFRRVLETLFAFAKRRGYLPMNRLRNSLKINETLEGGSWPVSRSARNKELSLNRSAGLRPGAFVIRDPAGSETGAPRVGSGFRCAILNSWRLPKDFDEIEGIERLRAGNGTRSSVDHKECFRINSRLKGTRSMLRKHWNVGLMRVIQKPVEPEELLAVVERALG